MENPNNKEPETGAPFQPKITPMGLTGRNSQNRDRDPQGGFQSKNDRRHASSGLFRMGNKNNNDGVLGAGIGRKNGFIGRGLNWNLQRTRFVSVNQSGLSKDRSRNG